MRMENGNYHRKAITTILHSPFFTLRGEEFLKSSKNGAFTIQEEHATSPFYED